MALAGGALREVFAIFGVQMDPEGNLDKGHKKVSGLKAAFEGAVAAFAGNALINATRDLANQLDVLDDLSVVTGIATDQLQELGFVAEQNGSNAAEMNNSLLIMARSLRAGTSAAGPQADAFRALGISMKDAAGQPKSLSQALPEVFANFGKLKSPAEEAQVAVALFGRAGVKMVPILRQGTAGLAAYREELDALGGPVAADTIENAGAMNDAFGKMDRAMFNLKSSIAAEVFPQLTKLVTGVAQGVGKLSAFVRGTTLAQTGSLALGVAIAGPLMSALGPLLKPGLKFAAIFLAMDDAIAFLQGKDSVIGAILNGFFGPETTEGIRSWAATVFGEFKQVWDSGTSIFSAISQGWQGMLLDMEIAIDEWVLGVSEKWNDLVSKFDLDFLKVDMDQATGATAERLNANRKKRDELQRRAFREQNKGQAAREDAEDAEAFSSANGTGRRELTRKDIRGIFTAPAPRPPRDPFPEFGTGRRVPPPGAAPAPALAGGGFFAPPPVAGPSFFTPTLPVPPPPKVENHIDARTTVHATTDADPKQIADAVAAKQKESLRNAYTSITARSGASASFFR